MNVGERVSYIGYSVLILMILGVYYDYKNNKLKHSLFWIMDCNSLAGRTTSDYRSTADCQILLTAGMRLKPRLSGAAL